MRPKTTQSWIVYPPNYEPGDGMHKYRHIKKAWGKACALGEGSELYRETKKSMRCGEYLSNFEHAFTVVRKRNNRNL